MHGGLEGRRYSNIVCGPGMQKIADKSSNRPEPLLSQKFAHAGQAGGKQYPSTLAGLKAWVGSVASPLGMALPSKLIRKILREVSLAAVPAMHTVLRKRCRESDQQNSIDKSCSINRNSYKGVSMAALCVTLN